MRLASPNPCCGPMVSSVRNTIRSSVPWRMPGSLVDIQKEYGSVPFGCQEEFPDCDRFRVVDLARWGGPGCLVTQTSRVGDISRVQVNPFSALGCGDGGRFCDANRWNTRTPQIGRASCRE